VDEARLRLMKRYLSEGMSAAQAAELCMTARFGVRPGRAAAVLSHEVERAAREMQDALDRFDETSAQHALEHLFATYAPTAVIRDVLLPYLHEVGERWAANHMTIAQEHFASNFLQARLLALARSWDRGLGPRALLACAPEEHHTFGLIAFGIGLRQLGWRITYLGAATPVNMVRSAAEQIRPDLIMITAALPPRHLEGLHSVSRCWPLAMAGAGVEPDLALAYGARYVGEDPITAAQSTVSELAAATARTG
jgi:methanogenic corrinoid protein MtbC1